MTLASESNSDSYISSDTQATEIKLASDVPITSIILYATAYSLVTPLQLLSTVKASEEVDEADVYSGISGNLIMYLYLTLCFAIITSNTFILYVIYRNTFIKRSTGIMMSSLAVADMFIGCFVLPLTIKSVVYGSTPETCILVPYVQLTSLAASVLSMILIAAERYHVLVRIHKEPFTIKQTRLMVFIAWSFAATYGLIVFVQVWSSSEDICNALLEESTSDLYFRVLHFIVLVIIPLICLVYLYGTIIKKLQKSGQKGLSQKRRAVKMFMVCVVLFVFCWVPFSLLDIIRDAMETSADDADEFDEDDVWVKLQFFVTSLALSNSVMNPIVYVVFNKNIRFVKIIIIITNIYIAFFF